MRDDILAYMSNVAEFNVNCSALDVWRRVQWILKALSQGQIAGSYPKFYDISELVEKDVVRRGNVQVWVRY